MRLNITDTSDDKVTFWASRGFMLMAARGTITNEDTANKSTKES